MPIPMVNLARQHADLRGEFHAALDRVLDTNRFTLGRETEELERALAEMLGVAHVVAMSSGTDALVAALQALNIRPPAWVAVPAISFFATAAAVVRIPGARPVFVDVQDDDLLMDGTRMPTRCSVVVPVHLYGRVWRPPSGFPFPVVEDACQAIGARGVGALGACAVLSFYPTKNLSALGEGGAVLTASAGLAADLRAIRHHGQYNPNEHAIVSGNYRMDEIQAAFVAAKLKRLPEWNAARNRNAKMLSEGLEGLPLRLPPMREGDVFHQYVIRMERRDALQKYLKEKGVDSAVHFPVPMNRQPPFAPMHGRECPVAAKACGEILSLPVHESLTESEVGRIVDAVRSFFG